MKRLASLLTVAMLLALVSGCGGGSAAQESAATGTIAEDEGKLQVVATIFPGYDFAREVAGDDVALTMLLPPGSESHSFEPSPQDIIAIQNCDVFIYVGGDSDAWVDGILESIDTTNTKVISMVDLVQTVDEEIVEGMEDDHGHDHNHGAIDPDDIHDRPLSDWSGSWTTIEAALASGDMDEYITHNAAENEMDFDSQKAAYEERWRSDYPAFEITENGLVIGGTEHLYRYAGYRLVEGESGSSVWYGFEAENENGDVPKYIAFSDHGTGRDDHEEEHHEEHDHEEELAHFHMRYGSESFVALAEAEGWAPTYFPADASTAAVAGAMAGHGHGEETEIDEHVWTSPANAIAISERIAEALCQLDAQNAETYQANCDAYVEKLNALNASFREVVANGARKTLIFGDRFPFRYFADVYGLEYYAAFPGCSTETVASAQTVAFLIDKTVAENIPVVFHIELSNEKMADTICEATGVKKLRLHSVHNVTADDFANGATYLSLMNENVKALKEALS